MEFKFNQQFMQGFTPPEEVIAEQFAKGIANALFEQLSDGEEKIVSISHELKTTESGARYEGRVHIEKLMHCEDCDWLDDDTWCDNLDIGVGDSSLGYCRWWRRKEKDET